MNTTAGAPQKVFKDRLLTYKHLIDEDIELACTQFEAKTSGEFGDHATVVSNTYTDILKRGGKRIRGVLAMIGYEMCGGTDQAIALQLARSVEMMHAYMLIIDDVQDKGDQRRGGPSAHRLLEQISKEQDWQGDHAHTGVSLALNAALLGAHSAQLVLTDLDTDHELRLKALTILNQSMIVTAHGQTHDIINSVSSNLSLKNVEDVLQWKTAHYTILNPLQIGMVIAGANQTTLNAIKEYALSVGKAFQVADDLLVLSTTGQPGKYARDDVAQGKQTLLTVYALQNAVSVDVKHLQKCLGNQNLSDADFAECQAIFIRSGATAYAESVAEHYVETARDSLKQHAALWSPDSVQFLDELARYLLKRTA